MADFTRSTGLQNIRNTLHSQTGFPSSNKQIFMGISPLYMSRGSIIIKRIMNYKTYHR
jgi:hypothetical protein